MAVEATTNVTTQPISTTEVKKSETAGTAATTTKPEVKKEETTGTISSATPKDEQGKKLDVVV